MTSFFLSNKKPAGVGKKYVRMKGLPAQRDKLRFPSSNKNPPVAGKNMCG